MCIVVRSSYAWIGYFLPPEFISTWDEFEGHVITTLCIMGRLSDHGGLSTCIVGHLWPSWKSQSIALVAICVVCKDTMLV